MQPKLSIIIPLYNAEKYISACIESLFAQTIIEQIEILVVDDHGQDSSRAIVEQLQSQHLLGSRIRLLSTPQNSGAWAARNLGISEAKGQWIGFVDADDWCEVDMYKNLLEAVDVHNADWAYCLPQKEYITGRRELLVAPKISSGQLTEDNRRKLLVSGVAYFWTGIYNREFLIAKQIKFPNAKFSEDSYFWWMIVMHTTRIAIVDKVGYHYRIQSNSVSKRSDSTKSQQKQALYNTLIDRLRSEGLYDKHKSEIDYLYLKKGLLIPMLIQAINQPKNIAQQCNQMINIAQKQQIEITKNRYYKNDVKTKFLYFAFTHCPKILSSLLRLKFKQDPF